MLAKFLTVEVDSSSIIGKLWLDLVYVIDIRWGLYRMKIERLLVNYTETIQHSRTICRMIGLQQTDATNKLTDAVGIDF